MKHILVALDLTPASEWAFERARQIAEAHGVGLTAVHVIDDQVLDYNGDNENFGAVLAARAEARLSRLWSDLPASLASRFRHVISTGSPWQGIVAAAEESGASLIVLGLHRVNPMMDVFIGTTAERIIRHSAAPVLMVRDKPAGAYRKVMVGTDFSPSSSHALQAALRLVPAADFLVVHIFETPFPGLIRLSDEQLDTYRKERHAEAANQVQADLGMFLGTYTGPKAPQITSLCERGVPVNGLARMVERHQPELLVIGTDSRNSMPGARLGSVAVTFLNDPPCDVLVSH